MKKKLKECIEIILVAKRTKKKLDYNGITYFNTYYNRVFCTSNYRFERRWYNGWV